LERRRLIPKLELEFIPFKGRPGDCFTNAVKFIKLNPGWVMVHGIPLGQGPIDGIRYGHAWCEIDHPMFGTLLWDPSNPDATLAPAALYYFYGQIEYRIRYTLAEAKALALRHGHMGPWDETILKSHGRWDEEAP
jgi:hypothetical protein